MAKIADDIDEQIDHALLSHEALRDDEVASWVRYLKGEDLFLMMLKSGRRVAIPREDLQYLADASTEDAAEVQLEMMNSALHWEKLDVDFGVKGLAEGKYGNARWMDELAERRMHWMKRVS